MCENGTNGGGAHVWHLGDGMSGGGKSRRARGRDGMVAEPFGFGPGRGEGRMGSLDGDFYSLFRRMGLKFRRKGKTPNAK